MAFFKMLVLGLQRVIFEKFHFFLMINVRASFYENLKPIFGFLDLPSIFIKKHLFQLVIVDYCEVLGRFHSCFVR